MSCSFLAIAACVHDSFSFGVDCLYDDGSYTNDNDNHNNINKNNINKNNY